MNAPTPASWVLVVDAGPVSRGGRRALRDAVQGAIQSLGAARAAAIHVQDQGDGFVLVVPPSDTLHPATLVVHFPSMVARDLTRYNVGRPARKVVRARLTIDHGPVLFDDEGQLLSLPSRTLQLANSPVPREALRAAPDACLVVALPDDVRLELAESRNPVPLRGYRSASIGGKDGEFLAWIHVSEDSVATRSGPSDPVDVSSTTQGKGVTSDRTGKGVSARPEDGEPAGPPPGPDFPTDRWDG
jgi:hypothetical protein